MSYESLQLDNCWQRVTGILIRIIRRFRCRGTMLICLLAFITLQVLPRLVAGAQAVLMPAAVISDPPKDAGNPARMEALQIPSHGDAMNAVLSLASGADPHPTVVFFHGSPGNGDPPAPRSKQAQGAWTFETCGTRANLS